VEELIYLSGTKLQQFSSAKPGRFRLKEVSGELRIPFASGRVSVDGTRDHITAKVRRLEEVKRAMEASQRVPLWFQDDQAEPGDWVEFEFQARYAVIEAGAKRLFFLKQDVGARGLMLLYGSPRNLLGHKPSSINPSGWLDSTAASLRILFEALTAELDPSTPANPQWHTAGVRSVLSILDQPLTAQAYVEGWARLIGRVDIDRKYSKGDPLKNDDNVLIASPLYIRHADRPR
jgi:hypothetical protein